VITPKFNKGRLGNSNAIGNAIKAIAGPIAKRKDAQTELNRQAHNKKVKEAEQAEKKVAAKKQKAVDKQDVAAKTYTQDPIKGKKGQPLTPAQKKKNIAIRKQNEAATSYMSYSPDKVSVKATSTGNSKGRPNTNASTKTTKVKPPTAPKPTVNKTAARNVRKSTKVTKVAPVAKTKAPAAPGRRKNGAPKI
jgi:hypothetical protein